MDYNIGDTIVYSPFGGGERTVLVKNKEADVKNGEPGFDGVLTDPNVEYPGVWGYDFQIIRVLSRASN
jgi:hypothetical protein